MTFSLSLNSPLNDSIVLLLWSPFRVMWAMCVVLVSAFSFMLSTLFVDVLYAWIDPRISYETAKA